MYPIETELHKAETNACLAPMEVAVNLDSFKNTLMWGFCYEVKFGIVWLEFCRDMEERKFMLCCCSKILRALVGKIFPFCYYLPQLGSILAYALENQICKRSKLHINLPIQKPPLPSIHGEKSWVSDSETSSSVNPWRIKLPPTEILELILLILLPHLTITWSLVGTP